jgi:2-oxoglutarate dehydrogenase E1 component
MSIGKSEQSSFLAGANSAFIEELYARYAANPGSVDSSWQQFFGELEEDAPFVLKALKGASWSPRKPRVVGTGAGNGAAEAIAETDAIPARANGAAAPSVGDDRAAIADSLHALMLIRSYRVRGHLAATLDPLGLYEQEENSELDYRSYGFTDNDLDRHSSMRYRKPIAAPSVSSSCISRNLIRNSGSRNALKAPTTAPTSRRAARKRSLSG